MFVGFTRFSLFQPGAPHWVATRRLTLTEYRERLFDPARLEARANIFFGMSLPQLALAANNHRVKHVVSYSDTLPAKYRLLLQEAAEEYNFLVLDECVADQPPLSSAELLQPYVDAQGGFQFAEYRLDDDDVLAIDYFDRLRDYLNPAYQDMFVSFGTGLTALYIDGELYYTRRTLKRLIAIGLAKICSIEPDYSIQGPPSIRHSRSDVAAPVIMDSRNLAYIWMRHSEQDSFTDSHTPGSVDSMDEKIRNDMSKYPAADDPQEVQTHFPAVAELMHLTEAPGITSVLLVDERTDIPPTGLRTTFQPLSGRTDLSVRLRTGRTREHRNVLVSFDVVDAQGTPASRDVWEAELKKIGVRFSGSRNVGYYRYFNTQDGVTDAEMRLEWPDGLYLQGLAFIKYRDPEAVVHLEKATISSGF